MWEYQWVYFTKVITCLLKYNNSRNGLETAPISIVPFTWIMRLEYQISGKHCNNTALLSMDTVSRLGSVLASLTAERDRCTAIVWQRLTERYKSRASKRLSQNSVGCVLDHLQAVDRQRRQALEVFLLTFTAESNEFHQIDCPKSGLQQWTYIQRATHAKIPRGGCTPNKLIYCDEVQIWTPGPRDPSRGSYAIVRRSGENETMKTS